MGRAEPTASQSFTDKIGDAILVVAGLVAGTVVIGLLILFLAGLRQSRRSDAAVGTRELAVSVALLIGAFAIVVFGLAWWAYH